MDELVSVAAFSALAHPLRLRTFRLLMEAGPEGLAAGEIARELEVPRSTLSAHLSQLTRAHLLAPRRQRQQIFYAIDFDGTAALVSFLVRECCDGRPELCGFSARPISTGTDARSSTPSEHTA